MNTYILPEELINQIKDYLKKCPPICITTLSDGITKRLYFIKDDKKLYTRMIDRDTNKSLDYTEMVVISTDDFEIFKKDKKCVHINDLINKTIV